MDVSLQSLIIIVIITILYFRIGKPQLLLTDLPDKTDYNNANFKSLGLYLTVIVFSQFCFNSIYLMSKCNSSLDKNIISSAIYTFIPWVFIFGILILVLQMFPGFKLAFSNVIGYFVVAGSANNIFSSILPGTDINEIINNEPDTLKQKELTNAAEAIIKICGNKSILINEINPDNFMEMWDMLKPLMVSEEVKTNEILKQELLDIVALKDNIGEAFWYIYTAILISSIVYYNLATKGCTKSVEQIKSDHENFIKEKEAALEKEKLNNSTIYKT
jgi:hypothetical protein